jgi:hypothetical protein
MVFGWTKEFFLSMIQRRTATIELSKINMNYFTFQLNFSSIVILH